MSVKPGESTSEFKVTKSVQTWAIVMRILGIITAIGSTIGASLGADTKAGIIVGAVVAVAGEVSSALAALGYDKSRAEVKAADSLAPEYES